MKSKQLIVYVITWDELEDGVGWLTAVTSDDVHEDFRVLCAECETPIAQCDDIQAFAELVLGDCFKVVTSTRWGDTIAAECEYLD